MKHEVLLFCMHHVYVYVFVYTYYNKVVKYRFQWGNHYAPRPPLPTALRWHHNLVSKTDKNCIIGIIVLLFNACITQLRF